MSRSTALLLAILAVSGPAVADDGDFARPGPYAGLEIGVGASVGLEDVLDPLVLKEIGPPPLQIVTVGNSAARTDVAVGVGGRAGFRIIPRLAVEAQYEWLPGFDFKMTQDQKLQDGNLHHVGVNVRGYVLTGRLQPFLLFGAGYLRSSYTRERGDAQKGTDVVGEAHVPNWYCIGPCSPSDPSKTEFSMDGFAARMGGGFEGYITETIGVSTAITYVLPTGDVAGFDYVSVDVGIFYRF